MNFSSMKQLVFFTLGLFLITASFAQIDSGKSYNGRQLIEGFYHNYQEYVNNTPFIPADLTVLPYRLSKKDTTIIAAEYRFGTTTTPLAGIWGFCDGKSVYVHYPRNDLNRLFYKLEQTGPYPYFTYIERKDLVLPAAAGVLSLANGVSSLDVANLAFTTAGFLAPTHSELFVVTPADQVKNAANRSFLRKLFSSQPGVLATYQSAREPISKKQLKELLSQFNNNLK